MGSDNLTNLCSIVFLKPSLEQKSLFGRSKYKRLTVGSKASGMSERALHWPEIAASHRVFTMRTNIYILRQLNSKIAVCFLGLVLSVKTRLRRNLCKNNTTDIEGFV